ncbi:putative ABC transport system permease protein [Leeuwenhoekiella aestuarii]|uniref:Putative ABC transport system permease protein n=1 Tax=Leeuwenhoekiella aestuarii TaxID=2249426 RepID=A0A4Q0NMZ3_9FLAO|nr:ABC transporter permease [Leeuwenhoekiella aestuarii]RXG11218.1 putative ABC transport system permease protein [Leeuwenhoekiella aestuarii]RXG11584.1 putative ABC transport system permease protein [Leeuwenhoekiella aestuarii]
MNIWKISLSNIFHKPLYAFLSVLSLSISIGLLLSIQQLDTSIQNQFENSLGDVDMVLGAKGSPLQLVLASVLHMDNPTGNISLTEAEKITKNPLIKNAVPISYGDNYKGFRILGTNKEFADLYEAEFAEGEEVNQSMEVILGSTVAEETGLKIGDTFMSSHGLTENTVEVHKHPLTVVGVYKPTYKVIDKLIVTPLESIWDVHVHRKEHQDEEHTEKHHGDVQGAAHHEEEHEREITSMLVSFRNAMGTLTMPRRINKETSMQAALPRYELERLFNFTGIGVRAISWIAYIILAISCITIFISLFKMIQERAFDLALMRTYGASNFQLIRIVAYEGFLLVLIALVTGALLSQVGLHLAFSAFKHGYNQDILLKFPCVQMVKTVVLILIIVTIAIVLAILPILKMNVSKILSNAK